MNQTNNNNASNVTITKIAEGVTRIPQAKKSEDKELDKMAGREVAQKTLKKVDGNVEIQKASNGDIIITIKAGQYQRESKTGDSVTLASTDGNFFLPDKSMLNLNYTRAYRHYAPSDGHEQPSRKVSVKW